MGKYCGIPNQVDILYATQNGVAPSIVANLRKLYEIRNKGEHIVSIDDYQKLIDFKNELEKNDVKTLERIVNCNNARGTAAAYTILRKNFTEREINNLKQYTYQCFSKVIDELILSDKTLLEYENDLLKKNGKVLNRIEKIKFIGLPKIFETLVSTMEGEVTRENSYYKDHPLIIRAITEGHIEALVLAAKDEINQREGIKFGKNARFVTKFIDEESLKATYNIEESTKERWMMDLDKQNPFQRTRAEFQQLLARQYVYYNERQLNEETKKLQPLLVETEDGFLSMWKPKLLFDRFVEGVSYSRNAEDMMRRLKLAAAKDANLQGVFEALSLDSELRQKVYVDTKSTICPFTRVGVAKDRVGKQSVRKLYPQRINSNKWKAKFSYYRKKNTKRKVMANPYSIFKVGNDGYVYFDKTHWEDLKEIVRKNTEVIINNNERSVSIIDPRAHAGAELSEQQLIQHQIQVLEEINDRLGFGMSGSEISTLLYNTACLEDFLDNLEYLCRKETHIASAENLPLAQASKLFKDRIERMMEAIEASKKESRKSERIGDSTYFIRSARNAFADNMDLFRGYARDVEAILADKEISWDQQTKQLEAVIKEVKDWIDNNWGKSSEFWTTKYGERVYYCWWLDELYHTSVEGLRGGHAFLSTFDYDRVMQFDDIETEHFSKNNDLSAMIANWFSISKKLADGLCRCTLFTTGDSLSERNYIVPKLSYDRIINHLINFARQEMSRMNLEEKIRSRFEKERGVKDSTEFEEGKDPYCHSITRLANDVNRDTGEAQELTGKFTLLRCLNGKYKDSEGNMVDCKQALKEALEKDRGEGTTDNFNEVCKEMLKQLLFDEYMNDFWNKVKDKDIFTPIYMPTIEEAEFAKEAKTETVQGIPNRFKGFANIAALDPDVADKNSEKNGLYMFFLSNYLNKACEFTFLHANPAAFGNSVAQQKRYKMFSTPGTTGDANAIFKDADGNVTRFIELGSDGKPLPASVLYFIDTIDNTRNFDPNVTEALEEGVPESMDAFAKVDRTDGQGWRTLVSYRKALGVLTKWNHEFEHAFNTIQKIRADARKRVEEAILADPKSEKAQKYLALDAKGRTKMLALEATFTKEEIDVLQEEAAIFSSIKPHTTTTEYIQVDSNILGSDCLAVPVEHKYAEALLIPEAYPVGSSRRLLGVEMEAEGIDLACSQQCVKVGEFGAASLDFVTDKKGNYVDANGQPIKGGRKNPKFYELAQRVDASNFSEQFSKGYVHEISWSDYAFQNEVPPHVNSLQLIGTQLRKHAFNALQLFAAYTYGSVTDVTIGKAKLSLIGENGGANFVKFYNSIHCANFTESLADITKQIGNVEKLSDLLSELKNNDVNAGPEEIIKFLVEGDTFKYPLNELSAAYDNESVITSLFKKGVNKQFIKGGSCVQVSDWGISASNKRSDLRMHTREEEVTTTVNGKTTTVKRKNITYADCIRPFDYTVTNAQGKEVSLKYSDYCDGQGYLLPSHERIEKGSEEYWQYEGYTYKQDNEGNWVPCDEEDPEAVVFKPKIEVDYPGILDIIAYRIPTERNYSMFNLKVKRFTPKLFGNHIIVPSACIAIAGFDFDIDKLNYFIKEFKQVKNAIIDNLEIPTEWLENQAKKYGVELDPTSSNTKNSYIWDSLYNRTPYVKENLAKAKREVLTKKLGSIYKVLNDIGADTDYVNDFVKDTLITMLGIEKDSDDAQIQEAIDKAKKEEEETGKKMKSFLLLNIDLWENRAWTATEIEECFAEELGKDSDTFDLLKEQNYFERAAKGDRSLDLRLYQFWKYTDLPGTASEAFGQELSRHFDIVFETYDYNKDASENTRVARNNELIKIIQSRLLDYNTFKARYTPGGFLNSKDAANVLKAKMLTDKYKDLSLDQLIATIKNMDSSELDNLEDELNPLNILTTVEYNARARVAQDVIGIMANHNTHAVYCQLLSEFELVKPITFGRKSYYKFNDESGEISPLLIIAEFLASSVDAVKIPVLNYLNINSHTASVAAMMARLGFSPLHIGLFLNQPIIREVCEFALDEGSNSLTRAIKEVAKKYGGDDKSWKKMDSYDSYGLTEEQLFNSLDNNPKEQRNILAAFSVLCSQAQALSDFIGETKHTAGNAIDNSLSGMIANMLANTVAEQSETAINQHLKIGFSKFSSEGSNQSQDAQTQDRPVKYNPDITLEEMQTEKYRESLADNPFAFEQNMCDAEVAFVNALCGTEDSPKYFPYLTKLYINLYKMVNANMVSGKIDGEILQDLNRLLPVYIMQNTIGSQFCPDFNETALFNKWYYTVSFPAMLEEFLADRDVLAALEYQDEFDEMWEEMRNKYPFLEYSDAESIVDNVFLDALEVESVELGEQVSRDAPQIKYSIVLKDSVHFDPTVASSDLKAGWSSLFNLRDNMPDFSHLPEEQRPNENTKFFVGDVGKSLAHSIAMYNFFHKGYRVSWDNFSNITPLEIMETMEVTPGVSYYDFFQGLNEGKSGVTNFTPLYIMFLATHMDNFKLVKNLYLDLNVSDTFRTKNEGVPPYRYFINEGEAFLEFYSGSNKNTDLWSNLTLPKTARKKSKNSSAVAILPAFKVTDSNGNEHLFVLEDLVNDMSGYDTKVLKSTSFPVKYKEINADSFKDFYFVSEDAQSGSISSEVRTDDIVEEQQKGMEKVLTKSEMYWRNIEDRRMQEDNICVI